VLQDGSSFLMLCLDFTHSQYVRIGHDLSSDVWWMKGGPDRQWHAYVNICPNRESWAAFRPISTAHNGFFGAF
jgi:hypothetical protein